MFVKDPCRIGSDKACSLRSLDSVLDSMFFGFFRQESSKKECSCMLSSKYQTVLFGGLVLLRSAI